MEVKNVKGTHDVYFEEASQYSKIETLMKTIASLFAYNEVRPPVLEHSEVFVRGVGESSDIVRKEMYDFLDKGGRSLTLRPEFTAGIIRLLISNKLYATNELPLKLFYCGPVFRYERPQLGRYRQFNQFGVESVGNDSPYNDVEVILLAYTILSSLGLEAKLVINTLGDKESRDNYREALKGYFANHIDNMCEDCKQRFELNPLRILDCKVPADHKIALNAPKISDYLSQASKERFNKIIKSLETMQIPFEIDDSLVRGLDYYSETVFEFHYVSSNGNNYGAIGAGGHYGNLVKELGGPAHPGIGFSFGIERIYSVLKDDDLLSPNEDQEVKCYIMPMSESVRDYALQVVSICRFAGYRSDMCFDNTKLGNMFKRAEKKHSSYAIIIGEDEMNNDKVTIKNLKTQNQETISLKDLVMTLDYYENGAEEHKCCCGGNHKDGECCCNNENSGEHECCCQNKDKDA